MSACCHDLRCPRRWIGWVEEVPGVNAQERSPEELLASLRVILAEALEFNRNEARAAAESGLKKSQNLPRINRESSQLT